MTEYKINELRGRKC